MIAQFFPNDKARWRLQRSLTTCRWQGRLTRYEPGVFLDTEGLWISQQ